MEDHHAEEERLLRDLRSKLAKEFQIDCWHEALESDSEQSLIGFYYSYKKIAQKRYEELELEKDNDIPLQVAD